MAEEITAAGGTAAAAVGDLSEQQVVDRLVAVAVEQHGGIDVLVNNAGVIDAMTAAAGLGLDGDVAPPDVGGDRGGDRIQPGSAGRLEQQFDLVAGGPLADVREAVRREIADDQVQLLAGRASEHLVVARRGSRAAVLPCPFGYGDWVSILCNVELHADPKE
ncbi:MULTISPECIES: SDR family NAD(P)-dependent oxidoreductase [Amycolatopsis]|uniref:SDR family NAD(P)-dependent oxidoreductase n=1 Tax=Amycolatopsis TaxID=1813 RepID=UPI003570B946